MARPIRRDRPSLRETVTAALAAGALGALIGLTAGPVAAAPATAAPPVVDPFAATSTTGPRWIVSPRAARPGEVVHVRVVLASVDATGAPVSPPSVAFAFYADLRHLVMGRFYPAEGTFGADLVVPPGTDWGQYPIVWLQTNLTAVNLDTVPSLVGVQRLNPFIPFVASRSAQPPLWNR